MTHEMYQCRRILFGPFSSHHFGLISLMICDIIYCRVKNSHRGVYKNAYKIFISLTKTGKVKTESLFPVEKFIIITSSTLEDI